MPLGAVPFPFGICRICRDKATGLHYGVATCEGCKGFFKRNIAKGETFKCHFGGSCDVTPKTRSHCKACRFKRCMETGMSIDGVRMGRVPKVEKDKVLEAFQDGGANFSNHELVLQKLDGGQYKFELNKTLPGTASTVSPSKDVVSDISSPDTGTRAQDLSPRSAASESTNVCQTSTKTDSSVSVGSTITTKGPQKSAENVEEGVSNLRFLGGGKKVETDTLGFNSSCKVTPPNYFTALNENTKKKYPCLNHSENSCFKGNTESEVCDNPFNDKYVVKAVSYDRENAERKLLHSNSMTDQPWQNVLHGTSEKFRSKLCLSPQNNHCSSNTTLKGPDKMLPYTCPEAASSYHLQHISKDNEIFQRTNSFKTIDSNYNSFRGSSVHQSASVCRDESHNHSGACCSFETVPLRSSDSQDSQAADEHGLRRRNSFSPALINVLLEQVLDSNEAVHVIAEKIQQKQRQGNFSESCAQTLCQHISELSAKRRRLSENDYIGSCQIEQNLNSVEPYTARMETDCDRHDLNRPTTFASFQPVSHVDKVSQKCMSDVSQVHNSDEHKSFGRLNPVVSRSCGAQLPQRVKTEQPQDRAVVSSGIVSSSLTSEEDETKIKEIKRTIDGIAIAMRILNRLKPEHREKIRQYKEGKLNIRVMTDSEEDVKEAYTKIISGIPGLNERIIGFCNSVPGFDEIVKEDRDALLKRAYYDIWMLCYSEYIQGNESYMLLDTGEFYSQMTMRKILNDEMVDKIFMFANQFNSLELTDLETAILCAVRLTCTDDLELVDRSKIVKLHSHFLDVFAFEVEKNHETTHARKLIDVFRLIPLLEVVNRIQREIIAKYSV